MLALGKVADDIELFDYSELALSTFRGIPHCLRRRLRVLRTGDVTKRLPWLQPRTTMRWAWDGGRTSRSTLWSPNLGPIPVGPLEVVEQAPHEVPAYVYAFIESAPHATQDFGEIGDALGVVIGGDSTLRQKHRETGHCRGSSGTVLHSLRPILVSHLGCGHPRVIGSLALGSEVTHASSTGPR